MNRVFVFGHEIGLSIQLYTYMWIAAYYVQRAGLLKALFGAATGTCVLAFFHEVLKTMVKKN